MGIKQLILLTLGTLRLCGRETFLFAKNRILKWNGYTATSVKYIIPLLLIGLLAPLSPILDHLTSGFFYEAPNGFSTHIFYTSIYDWGVLPACLCAIGSLLFLAASLLMRFRTSWQRPALVLCLTFALGSGVVINGLLKNAWGRPRPKQVVEYGGQMTYRPCYQPNFSETFHGKNRHRSFPSGHASTGFFFFSLAVIGRRRNNYPLVVLGIALATILGGSLSLARIAQGGHFLSDCLASALIMWWIALFVDRITYSKTMNKYLT